MVAHAGSAGLRLLADRSGLTGEVSAALARRGFVPRHDRGRVLVDIAVMLADGGEAIADIDVLHHQSQVLGPVASAPTVWRTLDELTPARLCKIDSARARARRHVWSQLPDGLPASKVADSDLGEVVVLDVDATIVVAHSDKEDAAPTFKGTFGFHPLGVWCDNTTELLVARLRAGNAGANTAADHIEVLGAAIAQIPRTHRKHLLIRADGAGASHELLDWLTDQNQVRGRHVDYSIGYPVTDKVRQAIMVVPETVWIPALDADGGVRAGGDVAEVTGLDLSGWPQGMRVIVRRERPHPGAQLSLFEQRDGWRYQAFVTNTGTGQLAFLEARHRAHARVEDHPSRERRWPGPIPVPRIRHQLRLAGRHHARRRPGCLAATTRVDRPTGHRRTQSPALPAAARARPAHPQRPTTPPPDTRHLALGPRHRCLRPYRGHPAARLTPVPTSPRNPENRSPAAPAGRYPYPPTPSARLIENSPALNTLMNDWGWVKAMPVIEHDAPRPGSDHLAFRPATPAISASNIAGITASPAATLPARPV